MAQAKGILIVMMEPPTAGEEEFNDWYDFEHIPERAAVPGFESALRYICLSGWPRYMALYDLTSIEVMDGPEYRAIGGKNLSVWSKRVIRTVRGSYRVQGPQLYPGNRTTRTDDGRAHLTLIRCVGMDEDALIGSVRELDSGEGRRLRLGRNEIEPGHHAVLVEHDRPGDGAGDSVAAALAGLGKGRVDLVNQYAPYWRR